MAKNKLVDIVKRGRTAIAQWRRDNPNRALDLSEVELSGADLRGADLRRAILVGARLIGTDLTAANLASADLTRADLSRAVASSLRLDRAVLELATLSDATLRGASLPEARLNHADLRRADLRGAELNDVDLNHACLNQTNLCRATLNRALLWGASFEGAVFGWTCLGHLDLSHLTGLDAITHIGPSTIGLDTLFISRGELPPSFLRGCGVSEELIANLSLFRQAPEKHLQYHVYFSPEDANFAGTLREELQKRGLCVWLNEQSVDPASETLSAMRRRWYAHEAILLCLSRASLGSPWIDELIERTTEAEAVYHKDTKQTIRLLYPLNLDGYLLSGQCKNKHEKQLAKRIAADFTGWRRNASKFGQEVTRLLDGIKSA